jgi:hypothetical protein
MKYRAFKIAFLLALATASTVSELHAIDVVSIRFGKNGRDVFIRAVAGQSHSYVSVWDDE